MFPLMENILWYKRLLNLKKANLNTFPYISPNYMFKRIILAWLQSMSQPFCSYTKLLKTLFDERVRILSKIFWLEWNVSQTWNLSYRFYFTLEKLALNNFQYNTKVVYILYLPTFLLLFPHGMNFLLISSPYWLISSRPCWPIFDGKYFSFLKELLNNRADTYRHLNIF